MKNVMKAVIILTLLSCAQLPNNEKTLVAWVSLTSTDQMEGSVISLQDGDRYDGIFLSAEDGGKWIAGSEDNKRTNLEKGIPVQESDTEELVQLAIVYRESEILMYRNGELKSSYPAENIDLLSSDKNFVLFGMNHFDGIAHMSEAIEDVRIYDHALTETEIKSLQPNEASEVIPYAWWNFEDEKLVEQTGKFTYHNRYGLTFKGFELKDGKLFIIGYKSIQSYLYKLLKRRNQRFVRIVILSFSNRCFIFM